MGRSKRRGVVGNRFDDLEPEIVSDILSRLPLMWMMKCKCVCKTWRALIKDDKFVKLQLHRTNDIPSSHVILESCLDVYSRKIKRFLVDIQDHSSTKLARLIPRVPLEDTIENVNLKIMCSLNGLICLAPDVYRIDPVVVCNPIIDGDFIILPEWEHKKETFQLHHITLGFDHLINKYKAVRVLIYWPSPFNLRVSFEVITIGEETSWRQVLNMDNKLHFRVPRGGVFHQGSIYWIIDRYIPLRPWQSNNPKSKRP